MITEEIKKEYTEYQIAKYKKMKTDNYSPYDSLNDLHTKLTLFSHLGLADLDKDLDYSIYLYIDEIKDSIRAFEIMLKLDESI